MTDITRLVIAGIGLVGKRHADSIGHLENVELVGIVDPSAEGRKYADEQEITWFGSLSEMFAVEKPDGVILATPTPLHVEQALECVAQKCPVLVEKPLATSAVEAILSCRIR